MELTFTFSLLLGFISFLVSSVHYIITKPCMHESISEFFVLLSVYFRQLCDGVPCISPVWYVGILTSRLNTCRLRLALKLYWGKFKTSLAIFFKVIYWKVRVPKRGDISSAGSLQMAAWLELDHLESTHLPHEWIFHMSAGAQLLGPSPAAFQAHL